MNRASRRKAKKTKKVPTLSQFFGEDWERELELEQKEIHRKAAIIFPLLRDRDTFEPDFSRIDNAVLRAASEKFFAATRAEEKITRRNEAIFLAAVSDEIPVEKIIELRQKYPYPFGELFVSGWVQMAWNVENWKQLGIKEESPVYGLYLLFSALLSASGKDDFSNEGKGIREAGEVLAAEGGIALMMDAAEQCPKSLQRIVDMSFNGIAGWMS